MIVAIDGPAGVGKSTVARALAERLGLPVLETGAMYRAVGLHVLERGVDPDDPVAVAGSLEDLDVRLRLDDDGFRVLLDGREVGDEIRTRAVSDATSKVSRVPEVRSALVQLQRRTATATGAVMEGRDIGTVVFPDTPFKFFLDASPEVRAERRWRETRDEDDAPTLEEILAEVRDRDERDSSRDLSPLRRDDSYVHVDTGSRSPDEVVRLLVRSVEAVRRARGS